ncbi:ly6/PLAUR domain-containing protein 8-like [Hippoglossus stenolepis]|uniref:ly6/PLAUR domain-containing protein 8-like n=1 Tax=Hippoglossus stenolepis TaxID=195615 RepID=UPI00159C27D6|nr:ly6/PLAUR domain-containing protein 8-like [Hippoglossus stenolepis]
MARIVLGIVAVIASFMLVDSLTCNKCSLSLLGYCISSGTENCAGNTTTCFTAKASFPKLPDFAGFSSQGCGVSSIGCNATSNDTLLTFSYDIKSECCSGDKCNPINLTSDAPATKLTFTAAIGAALLASVWGSMQ